ncbi:PP2C family protein-serine/threonine phosphatase [Cellulomonas triticagri]|uniref:Serine/threonine-protein phosphatase n=1 Tax=Cellulomonas triticagri TaxID=2483352 RepID=A0A3M2ISF8_9CELL|nr:PP2C family protein-serine/threonine phosphatase [Cellulomonas triticagri]RMI04872.1 serine/threonine-protein phosphatase [Cellulomonas triticagri]
MRSPWFRRVTAGSVAGEEARAVDWGGTPLGPPSTWPTALRVTVEMCFTTRFPVLVTWGPELTMIYNDGYREMLGSEKHAVAMGAPFQEVWSEIWADLAPSVEQVMVCGEPTWSVDQRLLMNRSGYDEETFFTYSYSPLRDTGDVVRGLLDIATETTDRVVERRRREIVAELGVRLAAVHGDVPRMVDVTAALLAASPDVEAADLHLRDDQGRVVRARSAAGAGAGADGAGGVADDVVARVAATGHAEEVDRSLVLPLRAVGDPGTCGVLVLTAGPWRPWDDAYRQFFAQVATALGEAVSASVRHLREVAHLRDVSDTLQAAILPEGATLPGVVARYRPASGDLAVGGDWYDVVELGPGRRALVVGDCVGHGLEAAARMGQLRAAARALLLDQPDPAAVLDGLDRFARTLPGAECTTVFCAVVDEVEHTLTYAVAGHLPPVLARVGGATALLTGGRGPALALSTAAHADAVEHLNDGDLLVVYTDGLVERRRESLRVGLDRLTAAVAALPRGEHASAVADALLQAFVPDGADDDVAVVVYRAGGVAESAETERVMPERDPLGAPAT